MDDGDGATVIEVRTQPIGVERLVTEQGVESDVCDERRDPYDVVALSGKSTKRTRFPSASTSATILVVSPPRERPMA